MLVAAHRALGATLSNPGAVAAAHTHYAQGMARYDPQQHRVYAFLYGEDAGVIAAAMLLGRCGTWAILTRGWRGARRR